MKRKRLVALGFVATMVLNGRGASESNETARTNADGKEVLTGWMAEYDALDLDT